MKKTNYDVRTAWLFNPALRAALSEYAAVYGQDAVDTCYSAWVAEVESSQRVPFSKPDPDELREFLCGCVGAASCL